MHLAYVVNQFPALSETFVAREVQALRSRGVRVDVYAFRQPEAEDVQAMTADMRALCDSTTYLAPSSPGLADLARVPVALVTNRRFEHASHPVRRLSRAFTLAGHLRRSTPDRVHAHWPYATMVTHLASLLTGVPYSVSIHAHEVAHENGHFREVFRRLDWAAFCNRAAMEHLMVRLPESARDRSHLVYHGVQTARFTPLPMPDEPRPFRVLSAGRLTATKGFDRLVRACARAREKGAPVELAVLGRGDEEARIRQSAREVGFEPFLTLPGWVSHDEIWRWMARSHVFALMANVGFHDGLPNVVLEAMASARPVVLSPLPAAHEAITPGVEGDILAHQSDEEGMADLLVGLAADPERVRAMGLAARARVVSDHDADGQIQRLLALHAS